MTFENFPNDIQTCEFVPWIFSQYASETKL
jgi:hypothetical protein